MVREELKLRQEMVGGMAAMAAEVEIAAERLAEVAPRTPLQLSKRLSQRYGATVYLKREDLADVRSFKLRGAYNRISALSPEDRARGVVCASAGNHAQGVAYACARLGTRATIFMPAVTPTQKIDRVRRFGGTWIQVELIGDSYDEAGAAAEQHCAATGSVLVHPFDDLLTIAGQGTVGREIFEELEGRVEVVVVAIGGGGLAAGTGSYLRHRDPSLRIFGAEPSGAAAMHLSLSEGRVTTLHSIDTFVDGAAVMKVGQAAFELCSAALERVVLVPEGQVCTTLIELYQNEGIVAEPAGALSVSALDALASEIEGRTVACVLSGGNNDILRYPEIMERSLVHQGRKHYFLIEFAQKPGQLRRFVDSALGPTDDIVRFEYMKKTNKERGAALVGIELRDRSDLQPLLERMAAIQLNCRRLDSEELLYQYLV